MLENWLHMPHWAMFAVLSAGFTLTAVILFAVSFHPWHHTRVVRPYHGVVPPYVNVLAVLLALLTGFVASETWERQKHAKQVVQSETDNILAVYDLSIASPANMSKVREWLRKYTKSVIEDEWTKMAKGEESKAAGDALANLMIRVSLPQIGQDAGGPLQTALLNSVLKIRAARGERISVNQHDTDHTKWRVLLILGFLTQCAIGVVHLDKPKSHALALVIFTAGLVSTLGLIAQHQFPFQGEGAMQPTALMAANKRIWSGGIEIVGPRPQAEAEPDWKKTLKPQTGPVPSATTPAAGEAPKAAGGATTKTEAESEKPKAGEKKTSE